MAKPYEILITNGKGSAAIATGSYSVTATVDGYDNLSIDPSTLEVNSDTDEYNLTISATGTLTLHVTDDGTEDGTAIVGAVFYRTDSTGNIYGNPITSNESGIAIFNNVPFNDTGDVNIYYKQTASDGEHDFDTEVVSTSMTSSTMTEEVFNPPASTKTLNLTDENYEGLPIENGTIILN